MSIQAILDRKGRGVITINRSATLKDAADQMVKKWNSGPDCN
jgi:hypothetical protein